MDASARSTTPRNVAQKLIGDHLLDGDLAPGAEVAIRVDQTLTQDATGTMVMLELEAMGLDRVQTEVSAQYVDHNLLQTDFRNPDDHLFLHSACQRFGVWYSKPGNGVSHPVHMQRFGAPGRTMVGSDSHTCAAGSIGMLAIGAGGIEVAQAMAGEPFWFVMPEVWGIELTGELPDWVSAKDVILEMLRRHGVQGGVNRIIEYHGPGLAGLSAMDRHVIANMGAELGATTSVFPSDGAVRDFLTVHGREGDWTDLLADAGAAYDRTDQIDLSSLVPLIACPSSPGNVVPVEEVAGREITQAVLGSSANPGLRDFAVPAMMVRGRQTHDRVSFDANPTSRNLLEDLADEGWLTDLVAAGARIHQAGCNGCIGMGQAPATHTISLRTMPRNFPGRSGTREDQVYLCSPETATASALTGLITDPRSLDMAYPAFVDPGRRHADHGFLVAPPEDNQAVTLVKGPNISSLPEFGPLPEQIECVVLLKVGDDVSTDEIMPAGARALPFRSNIGELSRFAFDVIDDTYHDRALETRDAGGHIVVGGTNYGQGSSREHAALAPRFLGLHAVFAKSFARIHWQNLANFGVLAATFADPADYDRIDTGVTLRLPDVRAKLEAGDPLEAVDTASGASFRLEHRLSDRQVDMVLSGGTINRVRRQVR